MAIADDISISTTGDIRYTGAAHGAAGAGYYSVFEFHDYLRDKADDAQASGDDLMDITFDTPSDRKTDNYITLINGYNIDDTLAEHLFDGTIEQFGGSEIYDGLVVIAAEGMDLQIIQDGSVIVNDFWNTVPNGETEKGLNRDVANGISHRFMLKVRTFDSNGAFDIDGRRITGITRETGFTYSEFSVNGTSRGNNVLALTYAADLNDTTDASGRVTITNTTEGYALIDINGDTVDESYYSEWNRATFTINEFYERMKYITRRGETSTLYGLEGQLLRGITHEIDVDTPSGTFNAFEPVSWSGGTAQMLAINSTTAATKMWIQLLTGVIPTDGQVITGGTSSASVAVNVTVTSRTISAPFCGVSTGSALIGAYGFGMESSDVSASDTFFDLTNTQRNPPNNVTFTVNGLESGEDRVLVGPETAGGLNDGQFLVNGALSGGESTVVFDAGTETPGTGTDSETDTPSTGTIRIQGDDGIYHRVTYTGYSSGAGTITFTGCSGTPAAADGNNAYISYIDKLAAAASESFTVVFSSTRALFIRVRDGGTAGDNEAIKTFETTGSLGSAGGSTTAIRTSDA